MFKACIALALLVAVTAYCPNGCSGHGKCMSSPKDSCQCFSRREQEFDVNVEEPAWTGADCSQRKLTSWLAAHAPPRSSPRPSALRLVDPSLHKAY